MREKYESTRPDSSAFLRLLELPEDIRHLVDWGGGNGVLGFSQAVELLRIRNTDQLNAIANAVLEHSLTSKETRQVAQTSKAFEQISQGRSKRSDWYASCH